MAIDDNKNYALTGAQIKDLADKVNAAQATLSDADYDYPANSPNGIALWLLKPGAYKIKSGCSFYPNTNKKIVPVSDTSVLILGQYEPADPSQNRYITILIGAQRKFFSGRNFSYIDTYVTAQNGFTVSGTSDDYVLTHSTVVTNFAQANAGHYTASGNNLPVSDSLVAPLVNSIKNGRTHAPTSSDKAAKGSLWTCYDQNDPTVGHIYMCTDSNYTAGQWTWIQLI